jgi:hypothetical protein
MSRIDKAVHESIVAAMRVHQEEVGMADGLKSKVKRSGPPDADIGDAAFAREIRELEIARTVQLSPMNFSASRTAWRVIGTSIWPVPSPSTRPVASATLNLEEPRTRELGCRLRGRAAKEINH